MMTGFRNKVFNQVICISTIEHIGTGSGGGYTDYDSDVKAVKEIFYVF